MNASITSLILLSLFLPRSARTPGSHVLDTESPSASQSSNSERLKRRYVSEAGGFAIQFPVVPRESSQVLESPEGPMKMHGATCVDDSILYGVHYADFPDEIEHLFPSREKCYERFRYILSSSSLLASNPRLISESEFELGGYKGRFSKIELDEARLSLVKVLALKSRVYLVHAIFLKRSRAASPTDNRNDETAMKFMDSFVLLSQSPTSQH